MGMQTTSTTGYGLLFNVVYSRYEEDLYYHIKKACDERGLEYLPALNTYHDEFENVIIGITVDGMNRKQFYEIADKVEAALDEDFIRQLTEWFGESPKNNQIGLYSNSDLDE